MAKYGKKFRKIQIAEWKEKYFNYKLYKQKIKALLSEKNSEEFISQFDDERQTDISSWTFKFEESLDKDIKKIFIFFSNKERSLYKKINKLLHMKEDYNTFELNDYLEQYQEINELSILTLNLSEFIYYNLKAIIKILKKYDKKVIGSEFKNLEIKINYIQRKLEEQNSDILYMIKFKMINEINAIIENLLKSLKEYFKLNKNRLKNNYQNDLENKLIEEVPEMNQVESLIEQNKEIIKKNINKIDIIWAKVTTLFFPWKKFLRISSDLSSRLLQITKENNMIANESLNLNTGASILQTINFSKESKMNIKIILLHGFLYMFSFSVIIPSYTSIFKEMEINENQYIWWGLLMMMVPFGSMINYIYEIYFFRKSTKKPIILSCFGLMIGNLFYAFAPFFNLFFLLFIGRFIIGLFNIRTHNKMYLINFLLRKDISYYLTLFHTFSIFGLGCGFLINAFFIHKNNDNDNNKNNRFNDLNYGPLIAGILSFISLILTCTLFTEAYSEYFNMTSLQNFEEGITNENNGKDELAGEMNNNNINIEGESIENVVRKQTVLLKDINDQLGHYNKKSNFNDTNLVLKSVNELAKKESSSLNSVFNAFIVYLLIVVTTKFINESIYINSIIFYKKNGENEEMKIPIVLGCSCFFCLFIEYILSCKDTFISETNLIIILLCLHLINNGLFFFYKIKRKDFFYIFMLDNVFPNLTQKYTTHLFLYIIPENYKLCKIHGNIFINIVDMISRIVCGNLQIFLEVVEIETYEYIILIIITSLNILSLIVYLIFYQDIRVKAITRIMKDNVKDEVKVTTEI